MEKRINPSVTALKDSGASVVVSGNSRIRRISLLDVGERFRLKIVVNAFVK